MPKTSREILDNFANTDANSDDQRAYRKKADQKFLPTCIHNDVTGNPKFTSSWGTGSRLTYIGEELRKQQEAFGAPLPEYSQGSVPKSLEEDNDNAVSGQPESGNRNFNLAIATLATLGGAACCILSQLTGKF